MQNALAWQAFIDEEIYRITSVSNASFTLKIQGSGNPKESADFAKPRICNIAAFT